MVDKMEPFCMRQTTKFIAVILFTVAVTAATTAALTAPVQPQTRIETDEKTGAILFIVNGLEEARINGGGLYVRRQITHGEQIMNVGESNYERGIGDGHAE